MVTLAYSIPVAPQGVRWLDDPRRSRLAEGGREFVRAQSFRAGKRIAIPTPATIADGLRTNCTGEKNFPIIQRYVDDILTVSEESIIAAMREVWAKLRIVIEPSAAVPFAVIREGKLAATGKRIGLILTGGNVDLDALPWNKP